MIAWVGNFCFREIGRNTLPRKTTSPPLSCTPRQPPVHRQRFSFFLKDFQIILCHRFYTQWYVEQDPF